MLGLAREHAVGALDKAVAGENGRVSLRAVGAEAPFRSERQLDALVPLLVDDGRIAHNRACRPLGVVAQLLDRLELAAQRVAAHLRVGEPPLERA